LLGSLGHVVNSSRSGSNGRLDGRQQSVGAVRSRLGGGFDGGGQVAVDLGEAVLHELRDFRLGLGGGLVHGLAIADRLFNRRFGQLATQGDEVVQVLGGGDGLGGFSHVGHGRLGDLHLQVNELLGVGQRDVGEASALLCSSLLGISEVVVNVDHFDSPKDF